jgi:hypothetical protein
MELIATDDAQIHRVEKDENLDNELAIRQGMPIYTVVKFDVSALRGLRILSAKLRVEWRVSTYVLPIEVGVYIGPDWEEATVTWDNMNGGKDPYAAVERQLGVVYSPKAEPGQLGVFSEWDALLAVRGWTDGMIANRGLLFRSLAGETQAVSFLSIESLDGTHGPKLIVEVDA